MIESIEIRSTNQNNSLTGSLGDFLLFILDTFYFNKFAKIICYPWIALYKELKNIYIGRHPAISAIRIITILTFSTLSTLEFIYNLNFRQTFNNIVTTVDLPLLVQNTLSLMLAVTLFGSLAAYFSDLLIKGFCKIIFGHPVYYITKHEAKELEKKLKQKGYTKITEKDIDEIITFCKNNINQANCKELGTKRHDWEKILDQLIYHANLDPFLEQQKLLFLKQKEIEAKLNLFKAYYKLTNQQNNAMHEAPNSPKNQSAYFKMEFHTPTNLKNRSFNFLNQANLANNFEYSNYSINSSDPSTNENDSEHTTNLSFTCLTCSRKSSGDCNMSEFERSERDFKKFKHHYLKHHKEATFDDQELFAKYQEELEKRQTTTAKKIYSSDLISSIITNDSLATTDPQNTSGSLTLGESTTLHAQQTQPEYFIITTSPSLQTIPKLTL